MVTVEGCQNVTSYEGIPAIELIAPAIESTETTESMPSTSTSENIIIECLDESQDEENDEPHSERERESISFKNSRSRKRTRPKPLSALAENLINVSKTNSQLTETLCKQVKKFTDAYILVEKEKVEIKKEKLDFEIKKFKFLHPNFK